MSCSTVYGTSSQGAHVLYHRSCMGQWRPQARMQAVPACVQIGKACRAAHRSMIHRILSAFGLSINHSLSPPLSLSQRSCLHFLDDDVYYRGYYMCWRLKLEGETENMSVCTKERRGVAAEVLMATPCTNSLGGESGGQRHEGCGGRSACWKYAAVSGSGGIFVWLCIWGVRCLLP